MTPEQLLLTGISAVTTVLCFIAKLLWSEAVQCKNDRRDLRAALEKLLSEKGTAEGTLIAFKLCPDATCPFKVTGPKMQP